LQKLEELCDLVRNTSLCGLGQTAPNPVLSTLRFFRHEYTALLQSDNLHGQSNAMHAGTGSMTNAAELRK
jgi:bidirectional [NiFe] hydrogenase diaphorase subunit